MLLSLNWLKEFVRFKDSAEKVADVFTSGGFEMEEIKKWGTGFEKIIVGQIKTIISHAEADKLSICKVDVGRPQLLTIVCGAKNVKPGQKVPVALIGAELPNGMKIERRKIRGVESEGMLCAEDELGLGADHRGILILANDLKIGRKFGQATGLEDTVLDLTVLPNRPDALSVYGLAREYAALTNSKLIELKTDLKESKKFSVNKLLSVKVQDTNLCPKYTAKVVKNIKVKPSPQWLQSRLMVSGIKPINNIVDITNYVLLEMGQPLHAFDLANVNGYRIIVRKAGQDKSLTMIDDITRKLSPDMLLIADTKDPIAVAGVMGGLDSEILKTTRDVVIESAIFKPISIRQTRQRLGLVTEASSRFEKGIAWELPELAADRAAQMMAEIAGGEVAQGTIVVGQQPAANKPKAIKVSIEYISRLIGRKFNLKEVKEILTRLQFNVRELKKDELAVTAPSFRLDISLPADIVEEVGRVYGWNNIKSAPIYGSLKPVTLSPAKQITRNIKNILFASGMTEVYNYSFYSRSLLEQFDYQISAHYQVKNPINPGQEYMRISLKPKLYENILKQYQGYDAISLFELGHVYLKKSQGLPDEIEVLAGLTYVKGKREGQGRALVKVKAQLENLFIQLGIINDIKYEVKENTKVTIKLKGKEIGNYQWILKNLQKFGRPLVYFEIYLADLLKLVPDKKVFKNIIEFPAIERDMTFVTPAALDYHMIKKAVSSSSQLIKKFIALDFYQSEEKTRDITFRLVYQDSQKTLTSEEVDVIENKIIEQLRQQFNMRIKK